MPPEMAVSMRHTKLKAEEAALLAGELTKPTWESRNEGIHERVSFEDSIWGFDLAGGSYYKTPLRVTYVKPDSRAEKAGIRPGDRLKRINDIETSTLTIQEAHDIIIESGIHLKIAVTAPEDEEDAYYCYEDPVDDGYDSEEERRRMEELVKKRQVHARVSSYWSLQWPWVSKRRIIYRESNCFMVPSKFEEKHKEKFPIPSYNRMTEDIVLNNLHNLNIKPDDDEGKTESQKLQERLNPPMPVNINNGPVENTKAIEKNYPLQNTNAVEKSNTNSNVNGDNTVEKNKPLENTNAVKKPITNGNVNGDNIVVNGHVNEVETPKEFNGHLIGITEEDEKTPVEVPKEEQLFQDVSLEDNGNMVENKNVPIDNLPDEQVVLNGDVEPHDDDDVIQEVLNGHDESVSEEEEKFIDNILNEDDSQTNDLENER